jgi:hypothetical protein
MIAVLCLPWSKKIPLCSWQSALITRCIEMKRIGILAVFLSFLSLPLLTLLHASVSPIAMAEKAIGFSGAQAAGSEAETLSASAESD